MTAQNQKAADVAAAFTKENYVGEKTMPAEIVKVKFYEDELDVIRDGDTIRVALKRACENIGLDYPRQLKKLKAHSWAGVAFKAIPSAGGPQEAAFLDLDSVPMWLATIELSRVAEAIRPKLERYQVKCAGVLRDYFFGKTVEANAIPRQYAYELSELKFQFKQLEATVKGIDKATIGDWAHKIRQRLTTRERRLMGGQMYKESIRAGMIPGRAISDDPKYTVRTYPVSLLEQHFARALGEIREKAKGPRQTVLPFEPAGK